MPDATQTAPYAAQQQAAEATRASLLAQIVQLDWTEVEVARAAVTAIESWSPDDAGESAPVEHFVRSVLKDYQWGRLTPERARADVNDFEAKFEMELSTVTPADETPEDLGKSLREELRRNIAAEVRNHCREWAHVAPELDLLVMVNVLRTARSSQAGKRFEASLLTGMAVALGRDDVVFCPMAYKDAVLTYIERLEGIQ